MNDGLERLSFVGFCIVRGDIARRSWYFDRALELPMRMVSRDESRFPLGNGFAARHASILASLSGLGFSDARHFHLQLFCTRS